MLVFNLPLSIKESGQSLRAVVVKIQLSFTVFRMTKELILLVSYIFILMDFSFLPHQPGKGMFQITTVPPQFSMFSQGGECTQEANETCFSSL